MLFIRVFFLMLFLSSSASVTFAETTLNQATACFDKMLAEAKDGASFSTMVEKYVSHEAIAAQAVQVQKRLQWADLSADERKPYIAAIRSYFAKEADKVSRGEGAGDYVVLDKVELRPRQHKKVIDGIQLAGVYDTADGESENFALTVVKIGKRCFIYDARWRDAWLSKHMTLP